MSQTYFILQLGYFKAQYLFFIFDFREVEEDVNYILQQYFPHVKMDDLSSVNKRTRMRQRQLILKLCNYQNCDAGQRVKLKIKARQAAMVCSKPIYVFRELMQHLIEQRIVAPGYSFMQDAVAEALAYEQKRLIAIVRDHLKPFDVQSLKSMLSDSQGLYEITLLKREPKDFSLKEIGQEINRGKNIYDLYCLAKDLLPHLSISNENIKYYASLVTYYSVFRLCQLNEWLVYVYLLKGKVNIVQNFRLDLFPSRLKKAKGKALQAFRPSSTLTEEGQDEDEKNAISWWKHQETLLS